VSEVFSSLHFRGFFQYIPSRVSSCWLRLRIHDLGGYDSLLLSWEPLPLSRPITLTKTVYVNGPPDTCCTSVLRGTSFLPPVSRCASGPPSTSQAVPPLGAGLPSQLPINTGAALLQGAAQAPRSDVPNLRGSLARRSFFFRLVSAGRSLPHL